jgi:hypothetical protein
MKFERHRDARTSKREHRVCDGIKTHPGAFSVAFAAALNHSRSALNFVVRPLYRDSRSVLAVPHIR